MPRQLGFPNVRQCQRLRELALLRDIAPGIPTTRGERLEAINRLIHRITGREAEKLLRILREAPLAPAAWKERTPQFAREHGLAVARLGGEHWVDPNPQWHRSPPAPIRDACAEELAYARELIGKKPRYRVSAREVAEHAATIPVVWDEEWGMPIATEFR